MWVSGWAITKDGKEESIFVGAIRASSEKDAWNKISQAYEQELKDGVTQRFIEEMSAPYPWEQENPRFPFGDWMEW